MQASEVHDRESLKAYLEALPEDERKKLMSIGAARNASLMFPYAIAHFGSDKIPDARAKNLLAVFMDSAIAVSASKLPMYCLAVSVSGFAEIAADYATASAEVIASVRADQVKFDERLGGDLYGAAHAAQAIAFAAEVNNQNATYLEGSGYHHRKVDSSASFRINDFVQSVRNTVEVLAALPDSQDEWVNWNALGTSAFDQVTGLSGLQAESAKRLWDTTKVRLLEDQDVDWAFWCAWFDRLSKGQDLLPREIGSVLRAITRSDWKKGPAHINPMFDHILAMYRAEDADRKPDEIPPISKGQTKDIERTKAAMIKNRRELPPTFETILGYISLEIERLQTRNHRSSDEQDEANRQIAVLMTLHDAVGRMMALVPTSDDMTNEKAEQAEGLARLAYSRLKEWPRTKPGDSQDHMAELVDNSLRAAMIGGFVFLAPMVGVATVHALAAGTVIFGGKKLIDTAKSAKDLIGKDA